MMRHAVIFDFINKQIIDNIHHHARQQEKKLDTNRFTAHYSLGTVLYWIGLCAIMMLVAVSLVILDRSLLWIPRIASVGCFLLVLYHITYRCYVDDTGITKVVFFIFKKRILWADVRKVQVQEDKKINQPLEKTAIFRNKRNKILFSCNYELVGFVPLVKLAKNKARKNKSQGQQSSV